MTKVALLHLDLCFGPLEKNKPHLLRAVTKAADEGAEWVITPETALHGYFWAVEGDKTTIVQQKEDFLSDFQKLAKEKAITLYLCCAEYDAGTECAHNSCIVIGPDGNRLGYHRKTRGHGSSEAWAKPSDRVATIDVPNRKAGILICADSWPPIHAKALQEMGADMLIVPAAWPPGTCGPGDTWEKRSRETGLPVWVCNQTGNHERLDFRQATSVVVNHGKTQLSYAGAEEAILLFDWQFETSKLEKPEWNIIRLP